MLGKGRSQTTGGATVASVTELNCNQVTQNIFPGIRLAVLYVDLINKKTKIIVGSVYIDYRSNAKKNDIIW